jgi:hypothetical protein
MIAALQNLSGDDVDPLGTIRRALGSLEFPRGIRVQHASVRKCPGCRNRVVSGANFGFPGFRENQPFSVLAIGATPTSTILNASLVACGVDWIKSGLAVQLDEMAYLCNRVLDLGSLCTAATTWPVSPRPWRNAATIGA